MPLNTPSSADEVIDRSVNDVFLSLQEFGAKPSLKNSWLNALIVAYSNRVFDFYFALDQAALEALPDTAIDNLDRWGAIYKVTRTAGTVTSGLAAAAGAVGGTVLDGTVLNSGDGFEYVVDGDTDVVLVTIATGVTITRTGTTATLNSDGIGNLLSDNIKVTVTGADQSEYNVTQAEIEVIGTSDITFEVSGAPATPATGTISVSFNVALMDVESTAFNQDTNRDGLASLQFESPIAEVEETVGVTFDGLNGAASLEAQESYRARILDRIQNPVAHFNAADIIFNAKKVAGVTRVFVFEITPSVGQVTVYFMRDEDDTTPIPDGSEVLQLKTALDLIRPANTAPEDLIVLAPTATPINFEFTSITPNTSSMKNAVKANLSQFFKESTSVGENVPSDAYRSIIFNSVDTTNGDTVQSFDLVVPVGDVLIDEGEIATLGDVTI